MSRDPFRLSDEYAAKWVDKENLYIFSYFEDEGQIRERINAMHLTLGEAELRPLADEACAAFGGCDFLKDARKKQADLLAAAEEALATLEHHQADLWPGQGDMPVVKALREAVAGARGGEDA